MDILSDLSLPRSELSSLRELTLAPESPALQHSSHPPDGPPQGGLCSRPPVPDAVVPGAKQRIAKLRDLSLLHAACRFRCRQWPAAKPHAR